MPGGIISTAATKVTMNSRGMTLQALVVSILVSLILAAVQLVLFTILRKRFHTVYEPRCGLVPKHLKMQEVPNTMTGWFTSTMSVPLNTIPHTVGLDAYFFLRHLIVIDALLGILASLTIPILIPIHLTGGRSPETVPFQYAMDIISINNITADNKSRYTAHLIMCVLATLICCTIFYKEIHEFHHIRSKYQVFNYNPRSSTTILVKGLFPEYQSERAIRNFLDGIPGSVQSIWFNHQNDKLHKMVVEQRRLRNKLEECEMSLIRACNSSCVEHADSEVVGMLWRAYIPENTSLVRQHASQFVARLRQKFPALNFEEENLNPTKYHRLKSRLSKLSMEVQNFLAEYRQNSQPSNSCFIQFDSNVTRFMAFRSVGTALQGHQRLGKEYYDKVYPADIIWTNLNTPTWQAFGLHCVAVLLDFSVILGWALPMAVVSLLTQLDIIVQVVPQLQWLLQVPWLPKIMTSVVSPIALSFLTSQVPTIFRALANLKGFPTRTMVEMDVQKYLFIFMYLQLFLIVTLAAGLPGFLLSSLLSTSEGAVTLASSLPKATNFFISYLVANTFTTAGNLLLQPWALISYMIKWWRIKTPRQKFEFACVFPEFDWGSMFPTITNIAAITLAYALVSPVILLVSIIGISLLFVTSKYRILYRFVPRSTTDGDFYPRAIFQLFSGLYCQQVALFGTLLIAQLPYHSVCAALIILCTILFHHHLNVLFKTVDAQIPLVHETNMNTLVQYNSSLCFAVTSSDSHELKTVPRRYSMFDDIELDYRRLSQIEQQSITEKMFANPDLSVPPPCVWIARDKKGVAADEVLEMRMNYRSLWASTAGAELKPNGRIRIKEVPPDYEIRDFIRI